MPQTPDPAIWRPVEELAREWGIPVSEVVSLVLDGTVEGKRFDYRWYVLRPVVTLHYPDPADRSCAELRFRACRLGTYLTAARGELIIPIRHGDPGMEEALALAWKIDGAKRPRAATVRLGNQEWTVDSTLSLDLGRCLLSFEVEYDMKEFPGGDDPCG